MGTKASKLQVNTMEMVRSIGGYAVNIVVTSNRGVPDVFACISGQMFAFEIKTRTDRLSELQKNEIKEIENAGGIVYIVGDGTDFEALKNEILDIIY